jgi:hypothetical protein
VCGTLGTKITCTTCCSAKILCSNYHVSVCNIDFGNMLYRSLMYYDIMYIVLILSRDWGWTCCCLPVFAPRSGWHHSSPRETTDQTGLVDDVESVDDIMRMQLKVADLTTGLSDKDIKKLTLVPPCGASRFPRSCRIVCEYGWHDRVDLWHCGARDHDARFVGPFPHSDGRRNGCLPPSTRLSIRDSSQLPGVVC